MVDLLGALSIGAESPVDMVERFFAVLDLSLVDLGNRTCGGSSPRVCRL